MKKLLIFLMIAIPLVIILVVNLTVNVVSGFVSIPVDSVELSLTQFEGKVDDFVSLDAIIYPKNASNQEIIWSSTNEDVATVDSNGNVSFAGFGTGYIIATTSDGNKKASCFFYITDTKPHEIFITSEDKENENYYVGIGKNLQLKSVVYPAEALNKDVTYTTENEEIATVDANGLVHGVSEGKVKIISTSTENSSISTSIIVEVVKPLESVLLAEEKIVTANSTYQISYDVYPKDATITAVQYKSLDEEIATVNSYGLVTLKKQGSVVIELTSIQGQLKASLEIEYTNGYAYDLILERNFISEKIEKGETYINFSTVPSNLDVDVSFSSDDEDVVYVDDSGYVQFIGGGNTIIRARVQKNETEYIEKIISVYIESPATEVLIDDNFYIATKQLKLNPQSYPLNSTNKNYYFESKDEKIATVSEDGVVTFLKDAYCSVEIDVYANEIGVVKKTVTVTYTNGYPIDLVLSKEIVNVEYGEFAEIESIIYPTDIQNKNVEYSIVSQNQNNGTGQVIELLAGGSVKAVGGGRAIVQVSCEKYSGEKIIKYCEIIVNKKVEDIDFETSIDLYEGEYVTCSPLVTFSALSKTLDATNQKINWSLESSNAIKKSDNSIYFNNTGTAEIILTSEDGNCEVVKVIRYLKDKIISVELEEVPKDVEVGDEYQFVVKSTIPSNAVVKPYLRISNQTTLNETGRVFEVLNDSKIKAIAGGDAIVTVIVANLQYSFTITGTRKVESIVVSPANIKTVNSKTKLQAKVAPDDANNKEVEYIVKDKNIATVEEGYLIFKKNGIAEITAKATDGSGVYFNFTIEKIEKGTGAITVDGKPISMLTGETNALNFEQEKYENISITIKSQKPAVEGKTVIELKNNIIEALDIGSAEVECVLTDEYGTEEIVVINVNVVQLCEEIEFETDLDYRNKTYLTAKDSVDLKFNLLPKLTTDKTYKVSIVKFISQEGDGFNPFITEDTLNFKGSGTAIIQVDSNDGAVSEQFSIKYTGRNAVDAELNYEKIQTLSVGEILEIKVEKWIPFNTENKQIILKEITHTQGVSKVVEISNNKIKAVAGGTSKISITISDDVYKELTITVINKVQNIIIDEKIISSKDTVSINPIIEPSNATNKSLIYSLDSDIARVEGKNIVFSKPGKVNLTISSTDGSNITKVVEIVSTFGYVDNFELNTTKIEIKKNATTNLYIKKYYPSDATYKDFSFTVILSISNDDGTEDVLTVSKEGTVKGKYGGKAIIRVSTTDYYGVEHYKDCEVEVISDVNDIKITFEKELETYQGSIVVAKPYLSFTKKIYPSDASNNDIEISIDNKEVAEIIDNKIHFLKSGKTNITFTSNGNKNVSKSYSFYYTNNTLVGITIDTTDFTENGTVLTLKAGENYKIKIVKTIPSDMADVELTIDNKNESRNSPTLQVMSFKNGTINALNGGEATFTLKADTIAIGTFKVRVLRDCEQIYVESNEVYVNYNTTTIKAEAYPKDTYQKELKYEIESDVATINQKGEVSFSSYGSAYVTITSIYNKNIYTTVKIEYANQVKKIKFNDTVTTIYSGYKIKLTVKGEPFNVDAFNVVYESSDPTIATVDQNGLVVAQETKGTVTIKAYVEGKPEIYTTREFNIVQSLSAIELELDKINDNLGIGGYRVWGTRFCAENFDVNENNILTNTYQMNIKLIKPDNSGIKLIWKSSNEELATVDENGLVTFTGEIGDVTISVEPELQQNPDRPLMDKYTFTLVDAVNVYSYNELMLITKDMSVVLQKDIEIPAGTSTIETTGNIYGNGHMINFGNIAKSCYDKLLVRKNNVLIDNVILRGTEFGANAALSELAGTGKILFIAHKDGIKTTGVVVRNTKIENAYWCVDVKDAEARFEGCIIRNALSTCLQLSCEEGSTTPAVVEVEDCIISRALFSAILFELNEVQNTNYKCKLILKENVMIYNWLKMDEFQIDFVQQYLDRFGVSVDITAEVRKIISHYPEFIYNYNGEDYFMLGIGIFYFNVQISGVEALKMYSNGTADVSGPYISRTIDNHQISIGPVYADIKMTIWSLNNQQNYITPASTYVENEELYESIRQTNEE